MRRIFIELATVLGLATAAHAAATPAEKCQAGKTQESGKYVACLAKADAKLLTTAGTCSVMTATECFADSGCGVGETCDKDLTKFNATVDKCEEKFAAKWNSLEEKAGGACPDGLLPEEVKEALDECAGNVAAGLGGDGLSSCSGDLVTCEADQATCSADLGTCNGSLGTCNTNLSATTASLTTCNANLSTCSGDLGTCNTNLSTCSSSLTSCTSSLATVNAGTAVQGDVLSGKTFSSGAGIGLAGSMANIGKQDVNPGTAPVAISQGYHDGSGSVAGDADLVAANIKNGVAVFGVTGSFSGGGVLKTGQTTAYGTGSDGDLEKGAARSYTDNGDGTITDNATGLMWEKKSDDGSIHDKDNTYTWGMTSSPYTMNGTMVMTFLAALNGGGGFAGYTDWRIPNRFELESLLNLEAVVPSVNGAFNTGCMASCTVTTCSCTGLDYYWSSTTYAGFNDTAWNVSFFDSTALAPSKATSRYVRAVRGGS